MSGPPPAGQPPPPSGPPPAGEPPPPSGLVNYDAYLKDLKATQDARKTSFEQRGITVITTSGTLVTLLFALAALSTKKSQTFVLPSAAKDWLQLALPFFFAAALAALITNLPLWYKAANPNTITPLLRKLPPDDQDTALWAVGLARVDEIKSAKRANSIKGWVLFVALILETLGVGCVAAAVSKII